jgi:dTDP-4-amino-4,6-dideoxyglucose
MFRDIFERQYYTNHGTPRRNSNGASPSGCVRHAMCVTNEFIGLALAGQALGSAAMSWFLRTPSSQRHSPWTDRRRPLFCDVDPETGMMTAECVDPLLSGSRCRDPRGQSLGDACDVQGLQALADQYGIPLYLTCAWFRVRHCRPAGGRFGAIEVISFHSDNILGACEGASFVPRATNSLRTSEHA